MQSRWDSLLHLSHTKMTGALCVTLLAFFVTILLSILVDHPHSRHVRRDSGSFGSKSSPLSSSQLSSRTVGLTKTRFAENWELASIESNHSRMAEFCTYNGEIKFELSWWKTCWYGHLEENICRHSDGNLNPHPSIPQCKRSECLLFCKLWASIMGQVIPSWELMMNEMIELK